MGDLKAEPGEMRATIHVTRKDTGRVDTVNVIGHADPEKLKELLASHRTHDAAGLLAGKGASLSN